MSKRAYNILVACLVLGFLVVDFFPTWGPPHFRYTGSDPAREVINLGYPLATMIVDPQVSPYLFVGPIAYVFWPVQAAVLGAVMLLPPIVWVLRRWRRPAYRAAGGSRRM